MPSLTGVWRLLSGNSSTSSSASAPPASRPASHARTGRRIPTIRQVLALLTLGAIGVVYGDIGTSPLYALREGFRDARLSLDAGNVLGVLSLIFWSLRSSSRQVPRVVMRADNNGEGGILALTGARVARPQDRRRDAPRGC